MATNVILPALGMSQDTGKIVQWLKAEGDQIAKGEPLVEIETDKATVEIEAPADGVLARLSARVGDDVPVGNVIAVVLAPGEGMQSGFQKSTGVAGQKPEVLSTTQSAHPALSPETRQSAIAASPLASRIANEHNLDLRQIKSSGRRIQKADVLTYLQNQEQTEAQTTFARLPMASPKARRLAKEQGKDILTIKGTGPEGAVLTADVLAALAPVPHTNVQTAGVSSYTEQQTPTMNGSNDLSLSNIWRIMADRTTQSWTSVPHFYLVREVNASRLMSWREQALKRSSEKITYTDLLVKIIATALQAHPRLNASWHEGKISLKPEINIGLAVAVEDGLVVPVIHQADRLGLSEIARQRIELVAKAQAGKLRPSDISGGTFTISNLGMYNVDAFNAIINQPQVAILAVGRITDRVVPVNGLPAVQPVTVLTLSCDHRAVDGARGAQFLDHIANLVQEPLGLLD